MLRKNNRPKASEDDGFNNMPVNGHRIFLGTVSPPGEKRFVKKRVRNRMKWKQTIEAKGRESPKPLRIGMGTYNRRNRRKGRKRHQGKVRKRVKKLPSNRGNENVEPLTGGSDVKGNSDVPAPKRRFDNGGGQIERNPEKGSKRCV